MKKIFLSLVFLTFSFGASVNVVGIAEIKEALADLAMRQKEINQKLEEISEIFEEQKVNFEEKEKEYKEVILRLEKLEENNLKITSLETKDNLVDSYLEKLQNQILEIAKKISETQIVLDDTKIETIENPAKKEIVKKNFQMKELPKIQTKTISAKELVQKYENLKKELFDLKQKLNENGFLENK